MSRAFSVTYDYRCPFARNVHEHVVEALRGGADWDVAFVPFSLSQAHVEEGGRPVWENPDKAPDLLAIEASLVVRDLYPARFLDAHWALFAARHDQGLDLRDEDVVRGALETAGVDASAALQVLAEGWPKEEFRKAHEQAVAEHHVFGVPTFVVGGSAVFVRIMTRPVRDRELARRTIDHVLDLIDDHPDLNEFKHTTISR
ncbi:MAG TPA: DsbA family protein [Acidimicrobiales bacterium]|nr:DsbA family protein [Acidimicrobiales bacterium]